MDKRVITAVRMYLPAQISTLIFWVNSVTCAAPAAKRLLKPLSIVASFLTTNSAPRQAEKVELVPEQLKALIHYDNSDVQAEFVRSKDDHSEVTLSLDGVSCAACAWLIENSYTPSRA